ncbi:hypothetical protein [Streptomyces tremellae]|uniref:Uncharacterized protein n=1 Tax=Streptomyces tremellae TaxID=1124239 RepID=A0ABP7EXE1_9ACTN
MRPQRFQTFAIETLLASPWITSAEPWQDDRPFGLHLRFTEGSELWVAITAALAPGERGDDPEAPVQADAPTAVAVPDLYESGKISPARAEQYIAAVLNNAGCTEMDRAYAYGANGETGQASVHPGVGVIFHNGARAFLVFAHTARPGQGKSGRQFELQDAF